MSEQDEMVLAGRGVQRLVDDVEAPGPTFPQARPRVRPDT